MSRTILYFIPLQDIDPTEHLTRVNTAVARIWDAAPRNTLVMVVSGQGSVRRARQATQRSIVLRNVIGRLGASVECIWQGPRAHEMSAEVGRAEESPVAAAVHDEAKDASCDAGGSTCGVIADTRRKVVLQNEVERLEKLGKDIVALNNRGICFLNIK